MRLTARDVIMLTQWVVVLPHIQHLPYWLAGLLILSTSAQLSFSHLLMGRRLAGWVSRHQRTTQGLVFIGGMGGIFLTFHTVLGLEAGTAFLVMCLLGKLFEVKKKRDAYVVLTLSLFIVSVFFLFDQGLFTSLWAMLSTICVFYAMTVQNLATATDQGSRQRPVEEETGYGSTQYFSLLSTQAFRVSVSIALQAIPLMVILFIFFPRIPPLWSIHVGPGQGKTGMSDTMSPGDVASLSQSSELAFRAIFPNKHIPKQADLYWRGLVLGSFDGQTWRQTADSQLKQVAWSAETIPAWLTQSVILNRRASSSYQIIMEPTQQPWLFALNVPFSESPHTGLTREFTLQATDDITQQTTYTFDHLDAQTVDANLPDWLARDTLQLPPTGNPQSRAFATQLFARMHQDPEQYAAAVLSWIRHENFAYTLQPPPLAGNRIDEFLFQTRQGFCEHYASAFTFLMRAAGVPARVVVGYQGGQLGRDGQTLEVRQMDAHAWSEIWLAGRGWVRYDPTSVVAPERIERGMSAMTAQDPALFGTGLAGAMRYRQFRMLDQARQWADYAKYLWQRDVVGFDQANQSSFLWNMFGLRSQMSQILVMFAAFAGVLAIIIGVQWWRKRPVWHPIDAPLIALSKRLKRDNLAREDQEGVLHWLQRVERVPSYHDQAAQLAQLYSQARYAINTQESNKKNAKLLWQLVRVWRKAS